MIEWGLQGMRPGADEEPRLAGVRCIGSADRNLSE